jgi:prepilin-type N-terminal cleavage/methylation domain-containing protein
MRKKALIRTAEVAGLTGKPRGFTLIELMVAMVVSGIVLMGIFAFSSIQKDTADFHRRQVRIQQSLEGSMFTISRDVRMAGLGFGRLCTEVRIYDPAQAKLVNPGSIDSVLSDVVKDPVTQEPYWVLRDGVQAHWRSEGAVDIEGNANSSAHPTSAADSFDVLLGERNYTQSLGLFTLSISAKDMASAANAELTVKTATGGPAELDNSDAQHLNQVRQMMPPGSFVLVARSNVGGGDPFRPQLRGQCVLVQVTDDIGGGVGSNEWLIPIGNVSNVNQGLEELFGPEPDSCPGDGNCEDWNQDSDAGVGASVIPVGHFRWSRYEIDYSVPQRPYLVRSDFIGWQPGDPTTPADQDYPDCTNTCNLAQLHLPNPQGDPLPRVAIGPMIEDMQVAVGCDGYTTASATNLQDISGVTMPAPDNLPQSFEEVGDESNTQPNKFVDEWVQDKTRDEWLGNAGSENWAPDCVYYGTGEEFSGVNGGESWHANGPASEQQNGPGFRMSPQTIRITLLAKSETVSSVDPLDANQVLFNKLMPVEDRAQMDTIAPGRESLTLTERFSPRNLRWRDPILQ